MPKLLAPCSLSCTPRKRVLTSICRAADDQGETLRKDDGSIKLRRLQEQDGAMDGGGDGGWAKDGKVDADGAMQYDSFFRNILCEAGLIMPAGQTFSLTVSCASEDLPSS